MNGWMGSNGMMAGEESWRKGGRNQDGYQQQQLQQGVDESSDKSVCTDCEASPMLRWVSMEV
jgi:hypothetical protein